VSGRPRFTPAVVEKCEAGWNLRSGGARVVRQNSQIGADRKFQRAILAQLAIGLDSGLLQNDSLLWLVNIPGQQKQANSRYPLRRYFSPASIRVL
jgi:hypothetical protein